MKELIKELRELVNPIIKGSTGYATLAKSEIVTAHKILLIIRKLEVKYKDFSNQD